MLTIIYKYQIPDPDRPIRVFERGVCGPSGELIPFNPPRLGPETVSGRTVDEVSTCVGTYGMGGPGFFGLRLQADWLVIAIWGASEWITSQGRLVDDCWWEENCRPEPWITDDADGISPLRVGYQIAKLEVLAKSFELTLDSGIDLTIEESPHTWPPLQGNGRPLAFSESDDLRKAVFLSPTTEIWI